MERTPHPTQVVAYIFAETDSLGAPFLRRVEVAGLHEAPADLDDGVGFPILLYFSGFPEKFEDPLSTPSASVAKKVQFVKNTYLEISVVLLLTQ